MWSSSSRTHEIFIKKHGPWLQGSFQIPGTPSTPSSAGRPRKSFVDCSERSKRRKTEQLRKDVEPEAIVFAAETCLTTSGKRSAATCKILKHLPNERESLTKSQYEIVRTSDKKQWHCYSILVQEKKTCYPNPDLFTVTNSLAEVHLQSLLNHTAERLVLYLEEVIKTRTESGRKIMKLSTKWGCDGSQQTQFNQKFVDDSKSDASIFQCSMVPLHLTCGVNKKKRLNEDEKRLISDRKKKIQDELKSKMGILVDIPKVGFGKTNNGNTRRRFFNDPETYADITGVDFRLIARMKIILEVISSGHKIDVEKFRQYTLDTDYVEL
ncbi:hypothetical protein ACJJTC_009241 [Scirpophaga incertulas]